MFLTDMQPYTRQKNQRREVIEMGSEQTRPPGIFLARSKNFTPDEDRYFSLLMNNYGLGSKLVTILMALKKFFYRNMPDDQVTFEMLHSACAYFLHNNEARVNLSLGNQVLQFDPATIAGLPIQMYGVPVSTSDTDVPINKDPDAVEEIEPNVLGADYSHLSQDELNYLCEIY